jgi:RNA polymerase sigma-70 factor (ECF subfamily)
MDQAYLIHIYTAEDIGLASGQVQGLLARPLVEWLDDFSANQILTASLDQLEDKELTELYHRFERLDALELMIKRHSEYVRAFLGRIKNLDREDVFQKSTMAVMKGLGNFNWSCKFRTWWCSIALNEARMSLRAQNYRLSHIQDLGKCVTDSNLPELATEFPTSDPSLRRALNKAFNSLPKKLRTAAILALDKQEDYNLIADKLGISTALVRQRVYRARQHLQEFLKPLVAC